MRRLSYQLRSYMRSWYSPALDKYCTHRCVWQLLLSYTFRNRTWTPELEYIGIWKSIVTGGRTHAFFSRIVGTRSTTAFKLASVEPGNAAIRQTSARSPGSYLARPRPTEQRAVAAVVGMGMRITTLVAFLSSWKSAFTYEKYYQANHYYICCVYK